MSLRVVIADDEAPLRAWLRRLLGEVAPTLEIVGEAADGRTALELIDRLRPDAAFLDIRMPELSGLDVAARVAGRCRVVFVTAHDEFAVAAFDRAAVDYLVKPVATDRLARSVERLVSGAAPTAALLQALLEQLDRGTGSPPAPPRQALRWLRVGSEDAVRLIDVAEVDCFKAADKYTEVHVAGKAWLVRNALSELERDLDPQAFWRIHRGIIVRVGAIGEVRRDLMGRHWVQLASGGPPLPVSRSHAHLFSRN